MLAKLHALIVKKMPTNVQHVPPLLPINSSRSKTSEWLLVQRALTITLELARLVKQTFWNEIQVEMPSQTQRPATLLATVASGRAHTALAAQLAKSRLHTEDALINALKTRFLIAQARIQSAKNARKDA